VTGDLTSDPAAPAAQQISNLAEYLRTHMTLYGYQLTEVPIIEQADLFLTKAGDRIAEQLFTFERHGQILALRPEFTASAAHRFSTQEQLELPVRWQFFGPIFSDTSSSRGYQQVSAGAELLGMDHPIADAEIINMAVRALLEQNITDWQLFIGHVGLTRALLEGFGIEAHTMRFILHHRDKLLEGDVGRSRIAEELARYISHYQQHRDDSALPISESETQGILDALLNSSRSAETMGSRTRHDIARRLIQKRQQPDQNQQIMAALDFLRDWMSISAHPSKALPLIEQHVGNSEEASEKFGSWKQSLDLIHSDWISDDYTVLQPDLARNWDYYTGLVFEIRASDGTVLVGGGHYDDLTRLLGARNAIPAVGLAFDVAALAERMPVSQSDHVGTPIQIVINSQELEATMRWADLLRSHHIAAALVENSRLDRVSITIQANGDAAIREHNFAPDSAHDLIQFLKGISAT
jgi:histidyl-tRNA synthetase